MTARPVEAEHEQHFRLQPSRAEAAEIAERESPEPSWQEELRRAYRDVRELGRELELPEAMVQEAAESQGGFPLFAPRPYLSRVEVGSPADPLLQQIWPRREELEERAGFLLDPVGDGRAERMPGVIQKYAGRALLVMTGACAIHCRYCFRRHFPYAEVPHSLQQWRPALRELAGDSSCHELILSGGDPLSLRDEVLLELSEELRQMEYLRRVRIHTRWPVVIPQRVNRPFLEFCERIGRLPIVVLHVNHPREIDPRVQEAVKAMLDAGCLVLNQAVLLRGINDEVDTLAALSERLLESRVQPYYLHQLDRVAGSWHFEVPLERGQALLRALRQRLPGYAVPRYVRDVDSEQGSKDWLTF